MGEFTLMEDWDLQAVVRRGCSSSSEDPIFENIINNNSNSNYYYDSPSLFPPLNLDLDDDLFSFYEPNNKIDQDQEFCKPFLHHQQDFSVHANPNNINNNNSSKEADQKLQKAPISAAKSKKRKNQQNRVVKHVTADDLSSDKWAWRKYGQKPIKGSPYPRSYYRCSSLKGCLARKQVERSSSDPSIFIITYTAEHSHSHPTRRNSLAGSTRIRSTMAKQSIPISEPNKKMQKLEKDEIFPLPSASKVHHHEDERLIFEDVKVKNEEEQEQQILENNIGSKNNEIASPDIVFSDDLFPSFEDFGGLFYNMDNQFAAIIS